MHTRSLVIGVAALTAAAGTIFGQTFERKANISGGGPPDRGRCTVQVIVDGAAEVDIRGADATLRNLNGQPPQWRRFECTSPLPPNPVNFRFAGLDGRGRQELVREPRGGTGAIVRIQDTDSGGDGYTFELSWGGRGFPDNPGRGPMGGGNRITTEEAVRVCQESVRQQAATRFRTNNIGFRRTALDDNPGRRDWVTGLLDIRRGYDRDVTYSFSCSVNFDTGQVRSAQIDPYDGRGGPGRGGPDGRGEGRISPIARQACEVAVEDKIRRTGYQHVDVVSMDVDNNPGRNDWIVGVARADSRIRSETFDFSCAMNLQNGIVRSTEVHRRP